MKASELYDRFILKTEENGTNDNASVDKGRFVILINEAFQKFTEYIYEKKNEDDLRYIQSLLVDDTSINKSKKNQDHQNFPLPSNYFEFSNVWAKGSNKTCTNQKFDLYEIKDLDRNIILNDEFNKPSFKFREAPFNIADNAIRVFIDNFTIDTLYLSYYRYPVKVKLTSPEDPESQLDDTYELDFDEKALNRVLSIATKEYDINTSNPRIQLTQNQAQIKP